VTGQKNVPGTAKKVENRRRGNSRRNKERKKGEEDEREGKKEWGGHLQGSFCQIGGDSKITRDLRRTP